MLLFSFFFFGNVLEINGSPTYYNGLHVNFLGNSLFFNYLNFLFWS